MNLRHSDQPFHPLSGLRLKLQQAVGKASISATLAILLLLAASSCGTPADPAAPPASGWAGNDTAAYRSGHGDGSRDRRMNRPFQPQQHPDFRSDDYLRGYQAGFDHPHDNPWNKCRASHRL
ncbi:hypothetical protein [Luteolibacter marinus]|uniref:hypothetical protein n=1 Tax=Luteolibacter marinus TaxID=2776705 RepID=UPI001869585E|nr:hypothetical protein [Luteolibacter marinus]